MSGWNAALSENIQWCKNFQCKEFNEAKTRIVKTIMQKVISKGNRDPHRLDFTANILFVKFGSFTTAIMNFIHSSENEDIIWLKWGKLCNIQTKTLQEL